MTTFDNLSLADIRRIATLPASDALQANRDIYQDDHWRSGKGWTGPVPPSPRGEPSITEDATERTERLNREAEMAMVGQAIWLEIQRGFVSENLTGNAIDRHVGGVLGRVPMWSVTLERSITDEAPITDEEAKRIAEAEAALVAWFDERDVHTTLRHFCATLLWATVDKEHNAAALRLFVPPAYADKQTATLIEGFSRLWVEHPDVQMLSMVTDPNSMKQAGLYGTKETALVGGATNDAYEACYVNDDGDTVVKVWRGNDTNPTDELKASLGGYLLHHVAVRAIFFGESVRRAQAALNKSLSMMGHNENVAGFVERTALNVDVPDDLQYGPLVTNIFQAQTIEDNDGNVTALPASIIYRDPASPEVFTKSQAAYRLSILLQLSQLHALLSDDAVASGESRRQAIADYLSSLLLTAIPVAMAGRWLLTASLRLAAHLAGKTGQYDGLRIDFTPRLFIGPVPADELRLIIEMVDAQLISREDGMNRAGIDDPAAMLSRIASERSDSLAHKRAILDALLVGVNATASLDGTAKYLGIDDDMTAALMAGDTVDGVTQ